MMLLLSSLSSGSSEYSIVDCAVECKNIHCLLSGSSEHSIVASKSRFHHECLFPLVITDSCRNLLPGIRINRIRITRKESRTRNIQSNPLYLVRFPEASHYPAPRTWTRRCGAEPHTLHHERGDGSNKRACTSQYCYRKSSNAMLIN